MESAGRWLVTLGVVAIAAGLGLLAASKLGIPLGRLPGDLRIERGGVRFYFPIATCLLVSALVSLVAWAVSRLR